MKKLLLTMGLLSMAFINRLNAQTPTSAFTVDNATVCLGTPIQISDASSDSPTAWSYTLDASTGLTSTNQNPLVTYTAAGHYTVTLEATNLNGAGTQFTMELVVNPLPSLTVTPLMNICAGSAATLSASGADTYTWSNAVSNGGSYNPTFSETLTVSGTDANNCTASTQVSVNLIALPVVSVNDGTICAGDNFSIMPTGATAYTISGGNSVVSPANTTTYSVIGSDTYGCVSNAAMVTVNVNALPVVTASNGTVCAGDAFVIVPTGASNYTFSTGTDTVTPAMTTTYSVIGDDANGCVSAPAVVNVVVNPLPTITVNSGTICSGSSFTINPSGASTYTVEGGSLVVSPLSNQSYTVIGTSVDGCVSSVPAQANIAIAVTATLAVNSGSICEGTSFVIAPTGAGSGGSYTVTGNNFTVQPTTSTDYTITGTDVFGCAAGNQVVASVTVVSGPTVSVNSGTICMGDAFTITPTGANSYTITGNTYTVAPSATTSYSVMGTDLLGCVSQAAAVANVSVLALPTITVSAPSAICAGNTVTLNLTGGVFFAVNNNVLMGSTYTDMPTASTVYTVAAMSANTCTNTTTFSLTVNALPSIQVAGGSICPGNSFTLQPTGGVTYTVSGGSSVVSPMTTTSYTVFGTDANGCTSAIAAVATVSVVNTLTVTVSGNVSICAGQTATLTANGAATYSWSNNQSVSTITVSPSSNSTYTVTGVSGTCTDVAMVSVTVNALPVITAASGSVCAGKSFTISPNGASNYTVTGGSMVVTPATATNYTVDGANAAGCVSSIIVSVGVNQNPVVTVTGSVATICAGEQVVLNAGGALQYQWNSGELTASVTKTLATTSTFTVTGTDANGCSASASITQNVNDCTGIIANELKSTKFYPNPSTGVFSFNANAAGNITVVNAIGQKILSAKIDAGANTIDLSNQNNGIYFVQLENGASAATFRLVKQ